MKIQDNPVSLFSCKVSAHGSELILMLVNFFLTKFLRYYKQRPVDESRFDHNVILAYYAGLDVSHRSRTNTLHYQFLRLQ